MKFSLMKLISVILLITSLTTHAAPENQKWLWATSKTQLKARHLAMTVTPSLNHGTEPLTQFRCDITSDFSYPGASVTLRVRDMKGQAVSEGILPLNISAGANTCTITLDTSALPLGSYDAAFSIAHTSLLSEPTHTFILRNVSVADLEKRLLAYAVRAQSLASSLEALESESKAYPYLRLKTNLVADVLESARGNAERKAWESLEEELRYVAQGLDSIHAAMVFGNAASDSSTANAPLPLSGLLIQDGAFIAGTHPVFLFGGILPSPNADDLARLRRYQLNAATIALRPDANPAAAHSTDALRTALTPFFEAAETHNVGIAIQLAPEALIANAMAAAAAPALSMDGRIDIAQASVKERWEAYLAEIAPVLRGQSMLMGVSLAENPHFHRTGEAVKAGFLDFLRANYTARLALNRAWRSHLATLEDITLWGEGAYEAYQSHRPFQFDWQTYHQGLGNDYFRWSRDLARTLLPSTPLMATLPDTPFQPGEAGFGVDREKLAAIMQISACSGVNLSDDPIYAMGHPRQPAHYTLLRSFAPDKPVLNLNSTWELPEGATATETFRFIHSTMWEGVMAGLSGATIPMDSLVFQRPEALEAFATAALDINRLAPIVHAFQSAPADVGILFSQSSRVFDNGEPHLSSAVNAYEGASFGGYNVRFVTESQCIAGILD
ncbi:MAG: hypothetical protein L3K26_18660, partial [Candidatus Hydrogenedentes bacterium]|nr:hypothetical protein [Candidatus Hydrogenedentota bacterium]